MRKKILIILFGLLLINLFFIIYGYRNEYLTKYDASYWKERYLHSQWVVSNSKETIGDDGLYAYTGWEYITGRDPTSLNAEVPPLGKYLIGLSIVLFQNQNIFALLSGLFVLTAFYFLNLHVFKDKLIAFIPVVLFSLEPLFYTQFRAPFLDLLYLGFFLLSTLFLLKKHYILSAIFLGCMAATKNSASTFLIVIATSMIYFFVSKQTDQIKKYLITLPIAFIVLLLNYIQFFLNGHSLREFLGVQKWILSFYSGGAKGDILVPWQILLSGNWSTWWGETVRVAEWHVGWFILFIFTLIALIITVKNYFPLIIYHFPFISKYSIFKSKNGKSMVDGKWQMENGVIFFIIWILLYLLFLSFIPVWPRYLLLILPFMYNLAVWIFSRNTVRS